MSGSKSSLESALSYVLRRSGSRPRCALDSDSGSYQTSCGTRASRSSILAHGDTEPVAVYLSGVARQYAWPSKSPDELRYFIEDLYLEATSSDEGLAQLAGLTDVSNPVDGVAMQTAIRRVLE